VPESVKKCLSFTDKLLYIYTSGTTGLPKAAVVKNSRLGSSIMMKTVVDIEDNIDVDVAIVADIDINTIVDTNVVADVDADANTNVNNPIDVINIATFDDGVGTDDDVAADIVVDNDVDVIPDIVKMMLILMLMLMHILLLIFILLMHADIDADANADVDACIENIFRFYFYCGGVYYMNAMYRMNELGKHILKD